MVLARRNTPKHCAEKKRVQTVPTAADRIEFFKKLETTEKVKRFFWVIKAFAEHCVPLWTRISVRFRANIFSASSAVSEAATGICKFPSLALSNSLMSVVEGFEHMTVESFRKLYLS
jgi:hypothetical protein